MAILSGAKSWAPFKIDALGIITFLASESVRQPISRLVPSPLAEYLPILAPQIIADNSIAVSNPGFRLYNITDGITAMDLSAWWTSWLLCQSLSWNSSTFFITNNDSPGNGGSSSATTLFLLSSNIALDLALIVIPVLLEDWYGFAASVGVVLTAVMRASVLSLFRHSLDALVQESMNDMERVKIFILLPNGKAVTVWTTRGITVKCFLTEPNPQNNMLHLILRSMSWATFGVVVVSLGMACLCMQLILVTVMLLATILVVNCIGCDESRVGRYLKIEQCEVKDVEDSRSRAYIGLDLNEQEEESMVGWHLFPRRTNNFWWTRYLENRNKWLNERKPSK